jgi:hypothetical protein
MLSDAIDVFTSRPHNDLLTGREENEAYCIAAPGREYAVYFTNGGEVFLDVSAASRPLTIRWLHIQTSEWLAETQAQTSAELLLRCPSEDYWAALVH